MWWCCDTILFGTCNCWDIYSWVGKNATFTINWTHDSMKTVCRWYYHHVLMILNTFHKNTQFTYELEIKKKISFLDVPLIRENSTLETTIYRKSTKNGIYLDLSSFALKNCKRSTLRSALTRTYQICLTKELLHEKVDCIERELSEINGFPKWKIN